NTIANTIAQTFQKYLLMPIQCLTFLTDNTNYMSGKTSSTVTKFNQITSANTFQILYSLHVIHIVLNAFETTAFEKSLQQLDFLIKNIHIIFYILLDFYMKNMMKAIKKIL